jgi:hypothetical protein
LPPSVSTVEVRVEHGDTTRRLVDPAEMREVDIDGIPIGAAAIRVLGYDVPFANSGVLEEFALPPAYSSAAIAVVIRAGETIDACDGRPAGCAADGTVQMLAQPFVTDFEPAPGETAVSPETRVGFVLATAAGRIDPQTVDIRIDGAAVVSGGEVQPGATLSPCNDAEGTPCGRRTDRQLEGFVFTFESPAPYAADRTIEVVVSADDTNTPARSFSGFTYHFATGS